MSQSLLINGKEYLPARAVGNHFGFTRDYILMLARDGKIDGQKVGHRWYINLPSAISFFATAEAEREARHQSIREERREELRVHQLDQKTVVTSRRSTAVFELAVIVLVGCLIGSLGYVSKEFATAPARVLDTDVSVPEQIAISFYRSVSDLFGNSFSDAGTSQVAQLQGDTFASDVSSGVVDDISVAGTTTVTSLIVAPDSVLTTEKINVIRDSFSDEVSVALDPEHPDTGIIVPHFKDRDGEAYRFLMVPVVNEPGS